MRDSCSQVGLWAKIATDDQGAVVSWHALEAHSADVAAVLEALLTRTVLRARLGRILGQDQLSAVQIARLCVLAALHDAGKVNHGFQERAHRKDAPRIGHVSPFVSFMDWDGQEKNAIVSALGLEQMLAWFESEEALVASLLAAFCHHGRPIRPSSSRFDPNLWRATGKRNPVDELRAMRSEAELWFPRAMDSEAQPFPPSTEFQHAFNGLLTLADWIGSDERFFAYEMGSTERIVYARQHASIALVQLGLAPDKARTDLGSKRPGFADVVPADYSARPIQQACAQLPDHVNGSLTILESPTGSGKTEAALTRFIQLFHEGLVDGMYFALPTRTAATELHGRVVAAVRRAFPHPDNRPGVVLAVPGYLRVDEAIGTKLPPFSVLWNDDDKERWRYRGWAAERPKRYLAGTVVVGTIDQVLLSTLQVPHAHLRAAALLTHLLIVDEVHASDVYMDRLLESVLSHHLQAGGHAFLMSATLGAAAKYRFMHAAPVPPPSLREAHKAPYPSISTTDGSRQRLKHVFPAGSQAVKHVHVEARPIAADPNGIAHLALEAAASGARVLVIRNTVRDCISTQRAIERLAGSDSNVLFRVNGVAAPHHSRFARLDRTGLDQAITSEFGKGSQRGGIVAIATQTVQQSLDLDADLLMSDLCPIDVLLQRIGRLHRHPENRPPTSRPDQYSTPKALILLPLERSLESHIRTNGRAVGPHGLGTVYEDLRMLEATWRLVEAHSTWVIPTMNRELVERGTHPEALARIVSSLGGRWEQHATYILGIHSAGRSYASLVLLPRAKPFGTEEFPRDLNERIKTRLGEGDRTVDLEEDVISPFGNKIRKLTLPAHYVSDTDDDAEAEDIVIESGSVEFTFGGRAFVYDRLGLRPQGAGRQEEDSHV